MFKPLVDTKLCAPLVTCYLTYFNAFLEVTENSRFGFDPKPGAHKQKVPLPKDSWNRLCKRKWSLFAQESQVTKERANVPDNYLSLRIVF